MKTFEKIGLILHINMLVNLLIFMPIIRAGWFSGDTLSEKMIAVEVVLVLSTVVATIAADYYIKWWVNYQKNNRM